MQRRHESEGLAAEKGDEMTMLVRVSCLWSDQWENIKKHTASFSMPPIFKNAESRWEH